MKFQTTFEIGDWSHDGHCISEDVVVKHNKTYNCIRDHYRMAQKEHGIDFETLCEDYDDSTIKFGDLEKLVELGIISQDEVEDDEYWVQGAKDFVRLYLEYTKTYLNTLEYKFVDVHKVHLGGYGLFRT